MILYIVGFWCVTTVKINEINRFFLPSKLQTDYISGHHV